MADFTTYANGDVVALSGGGNPASYPAVTVLENSYDVARGTVTAGDTCTEFLKIPAGSYVREVMVDVLVPEAGVSIDVGIAAASDGWVAAQSLAVAGKFAGAGASLGNFLDADTWLQFTVTGADLTVGQIRIAAVVANCG